VFEECIVSRALVCLNLAVKVCKCCLVDSNIPSTSVIFNYPLLSLELGRQIPKMVSIETIKPEVRPKRIR